MRKLVWFCSILLFSVVSTLACLALIAEGRTAPGVPAALIDVEARTSQLSHQQIFQSMSQSASDNGVAVLKVQPSSDSDVVALAEIFVPETLVVPSKFFEPGRSVEVSPFESLENSRSGGRYVIYGETSSAQEFVQSMYELEVLVMPFYPEYRDSLRAFIEIPVVLWVIMGLVLLVSSSGMLLAVSDQKRQSILILNGQRTAAVLIGSYLRFFAMFLCAFAGIFGISSILVAAIRGAEFLEAYARYFFAPALLSLAASMLVSAAWVIFYRIRSSSLLDRVSDHKRVAGMTVGHSFVATVAVGLALSSSLVAVQQAEALQDSLSYWDDLEEYVAVGIISSTTNEDIKAHAPQMGEVIKSADTQGDLVLCFNVDEAILRDDVDLDNGLFPGDVVLVNEAYLSLLNPSTAKDLKLIDRHPPKVKAALDGYLNGLWSAKPKRPWQEVEREVRVMQYSGSSGLPVIGSGTELTFPKESTIVVVPSVSGYLDTDNTVSIMSTGNIFFKGKDATIKLLSDVGLGSFYRVEKMSEEGQVVVAYERFRYIFLILTTIAAGVSAMLTGFLAARAYTQINQVKVRLGWLHGHPQIKMFRRRWLRDACLVGLALLPSIVWLIYRENWIATGVVLLFGFLIYLVSCLSISKAASDICVNMTSRRA